MAAIAMLSILGWALHELVRAVETRILRAR
jgi:ABC-type nitrate/sulfonate/bicarbonate transport system permease component